MLCERTPNYVPPICCDTKLSIQVYEKMESTKKWHSTPLHGLLNFVSQANYITKFGKCKHDLFIN